MKCSICGKPLKNTDYVCSFGCAKYTLVESIKELYEQYPELQVYNDNVEALTPNAHE